MLLRLMLSRSSSFGRTLTLIDAQAEVGRSSALEVLSKHFRGLVTEFGDSSATLKRPRHTCTAMRSSKKTLAKTIEHNFIILYLMTDQWIDLNI